MERQTHAGAGLGRGQRLRDLSEAGSRFAACTTEFVAGVLSVGLAAFSQDAGVRMMSVAATGGLSTV
jgi:hypothetical protein